MTASLGSAATRIAEDLVCGTPGCGPSAAAVGVSDSGSDLAVVVRGNPRALDDSGRPVAPTPLADEPVFDVGSVTKVVTTLLCLCLVEQRRLRLDAPISHWFGDVAGTGRHLVTVRDLLEHQAGLWEWWPTYAGGARQSDEALAVVRRLPARYPPRMGRHYSDLGFMLLGEIVAREYGEPLADAARSELFDPLGMGSSGYRTRGMAASTGHVVATSLGDWYERRMLSTGTPYPVQVTDDSFTGWRHYVLVGEANDGNCWHGFGGVAGHAGLFTSVPDLLRLGRALLTSLEGRGPWKQEIVDEFARPGRDPAQGLGFRTWQRRSGAVIGHPGFPGARFAVLQGGARVAVLLTNRLHTPGEPPTVDDAWERLLEAVESE